MSRWGEQLISLWWNHSSRLRGIVRTHLETDRRMGRRANIQVSNNISTPVYLMVSRTILDWCKLWKCRHRQVTKNKRTHDRTLTNELIFWQTSSKTPQQNKSKVIFFSNLSSWILYKTLTIVIKPIHPLAETVTYKQKKIKITT